MSPLGKRCFFEIDSNFKLIDGRVLAPLSKFQPWGKHQLQLETRPPMGFYNTRLLLKHPALADRPDVC